MERSVASLTYEGSVSEAIVEAQRQKKLFVVYISGDDENSIHLERTTLVDNNVAESMSRYCIFLHLIHGSIDALQFSAIYPQKSVPSITAVGFNGVMLWQHEGYISGENFVGSIEKAWATVHFQETAVTLLTAAIASNKPEPLNSSPQEAAQGNSSSLDTASTSAGKSLESLEEKSSDVSKPSVEDVVAEPIDDKNEGPGPETSSRSGAVDDREIIREEQTILESNTREEVLSSVTRDLYNPSTCDDIDVCAAPKETLASDESYTEASPASIEKTTAYSLNSLQTSDIVEEENANSEEVAEPTEYLNATKSEDIFLNIRLPNGASLQRKFMLTDTLRSVKNYVDKNQSGGAGSYDLAVPYPRKVFSEHDMTSVLSELGFGARQALIVVPHRQAIRSQKRSMPAAHEGQTAASMINETDNGGYFGFVKRVLSYMNPFSYLGGSADSSNSEPAPNNGYQQYRPAHAFQSSHFSGAETSNRPFSSSQSAGENTGETSRRASRPFGSNIHTLRHDEDDFQSGDRNTFWNGNSTQFGGDDDKK
ncbi:plant UBX domain-containing protein 11 isoform X2 [Asparagus officinalis]|uniref:plant UBX domain-containing protein 11 isoform X2 n=1 Tax=Asparagus officinalis TaxID=4686 RepID=UPI00098E55B6|nr:plant UBX domain-containing protein 11 isoform X2 [Asparagus officinalis]